jgi:hypothetical protein
MGVESLSVPELDAATEGSAEGIRFESGRMPDRAAVRLGARCESEVCSRGVLGALQAT